MFLIVDTTTDPAWNLAVEEYLLDRRGESFFRLWRNADSVIIGRHQNAWAEIDPVFTERNEIPVIRRMTGGGAVFHDPGNVNYSFFNLKERNFTDLILDALRPLGLEGRCEGRNDLTLDGRKFSGTAVCKRGDRVLQHGTLLFNASVGHLTAALRPRAEKFEGKAVQSVRSRITNLADHLREPMDTEAFIAHLAAFIGKKLDCTPYAYTEADLSAIRKLRDERFGNPAWNFGASPDCRFSKVRKFPAGLIEAHFDLGDGRIRNLQIFGDYFFDRPTEDFCACLEGVPYDRKTIADRLQKVAAGEYFKGVSTTELLNLFF